MDDEHKQIADGILDEAREEAKRILAEWRTSAETRRIATEKRITEMGKETDLRIQSEHSRVHARVDTQIAVEQKRAKLRVQDTAYREVERRTVQALRELVGSSDYDQIVLGWIVEAGVGLGAKAASVNCSAGERDAVTRVLPLAQERIAAELGHSVQLELSTDEPTMEQGVVLDARQSPIAFGNSVVDRLHRERGAIRRIIHDRLFKDI